MKAYQIYIKNENGEEIIGNYASALVASFVMQQKGENAHMRAVELDEQDND